VSNLQYVLNRLPIGMVTLSRDFRIQNFGGEAERFFGRDRLQNAIGQSIHTLHASHSGHTQSKIDWLLQHVGDEDAPHFASMLINVPDTILQLRIIRLHDASGISGYSLILYDITDLASNPVEERTKVEGDASMRRLVKLPVVSQGQIALLDIEEVAFLRADSHYTQACANGKLYFCNLALSQVEQRLPERFIRVHRSYVVNLDFIESVKRTDDQFFLSMVGTEEKIPVSRSNAPRIRELLGV
jgi:LytTR family transcriptional regulator, CO-responsive transcriptional regulator RcoM